MIASTAEAALRRIAAPGTVRPDILIHALAQLPDDVGLDLNDDDGDRAGLELLAAAYGIRERVRLGAGRIPRDVVEVATNSTMAELLRALSHADDPPSACRRGSDRFLAGHSIAVVTNLPAPYRIPLFERMAHRLRFANADFRVFFLGRGTGGRSWMGGTGDWAFEHEFLSSVELPAAGRRPLAPVDLERRLSAFRPTLLLSAGFSPAVSVRAALYARRRGAKFGLWSGEHASMATARSRPRAALRRWLVKRADFAIAYGFRAAEYLRELSVGLPLVYGRNTSETSSLSRPRPAHPEQIEFLAVGDLSSPRKGTDVLIDALRLAPDLPCRLTVIGGGALLPELRRRAEGDGRVRFLGPLPSADVRSAYRTADVFLFPSRADVFGLVLVEAMGSGLGVVSSNEPGAVADIAVHGWNCLVLDDHRPELWAAAIERIARDHELRLVLSERAEQTIRDRWTLDHASDAMIAGLRLGALVRRRR